MSGKAGFPGFGYTGHGLREVSLLRSIVLLSVVLLVSPVSAEGDPDVAALLDRVVDAYGGSGALAACPGFRARGKILSFADGMNGSVTVALSLDDAMRVEIRYPDRAETRILSGKLVWDGGRTRQKPSGGSRASAIRLQYHRLAAPFEFIGQDADRFEPAGTSDEGWFRLRRQWTQDLYTIYEIDPETGRIHRTRGVIAAEGGELEFVSESWDFREVDGILFPFRTTTWVGDHAAAETIFDRISIEAEFPATTFVPTNTGGDI